MIARLTRMGRDAMSVVNRQKSEGATNAPTASNFRQRQDNMALNGLQDLRDIACNYAIKYRWDPVLSRTHEEYVNLLNLILKECVK